MKSVRMMIHGMVAAITCSMLAATFAPQALAADPIKPGVLPKQWQSGGPNCIEVSAPFQIHQYNEDFFILRESGCVHDEKPFLYLLFGRDRALLLDTGAGKEGTTDMPNVADNVRYVVNSWLARNNRRSIPLIVAHLHSHGDHTYGDSQFTKLPDTTLVPPNDVKVLQKAFGIRNWPTDIAAYDLGGRVLDVIPIPGHDDTSIAIYDRQTGVLLTGDTLYPGRIFINADHDTFARSIQRLVDFTKDKVVTHVLGTHIEQKGPYADYPVGTHYAPDEIGLALGRGHLLELLEATTYRKDGLIVQRAYRDFSVCGKYPECKPVNR